MAKISAALKEHFENSPGRQVAYLNANGEWLGHAHPAFPHKVTRDKVLAADAETGESTPAADVETGGKDTTSPTIPVTATKENLKTLPKGTKIGNIVEIENPNYVDPLA